MAELDRVHNDGQLNQLAEEVVNHLRLEFDRLKEEISLLCDSDRLLNKSEAAAYLGIKVPTLSTWITRGTSPRYTKIGALVMFRKEWIDEFIEQRAV